MGILLTFTPEGPRLGWELILWETTCHHVSYKRRYYLPTPHWVPCTPPPSLPPPAYQPVWVQSGSLHTTSCTVPLPTACHFWVVGSRAGSIFVHTTSTAPYPLSVGKVFTHCRRGQRDRLPPPPQVGLVHAHMPARQQTRLGTW